jgi:rubrerythrin
MEKIIWEKSKNNLKKKLSHDKSFLENVEFVIETERNSFERKYSNTLIPSIPNVSPKEELISLLKLAAEVEHTLLIQYLYAAYTISDDSALKRTIIFIAVQEMGHLLAVQNLLLSIGGVENLHLSKSDYRLNSGEKLLPYTLEPFSKLVLSKFVAVEAPVKIPNEYKKEVDEIHKIAKGNAGIEFNPVGGLYMKIFWLFQENDNPVESMKIFPNELFVSGRHIEKRDFLPKSEIEKYEAQWGAWNMAGSSSKGHHGLQNIVTSVYEMKDALEVVKAISEQGEGADMSELDSHFEKFLTAYREYDKNPPNIILAPVNPISQNNIEFSNPTQIENKYTLLWNRLLNKVYSSLLLDIFSCMFYFDMNENNKRQYIELVFTNMNSLLKMLSKILFKLPLNEGEFESNYAPISAPTFEIDTEFRICKTKSELTLLNTQFITNIIETMTEIETHEIYPSHYEKDNDAITIFMSINEYVNKKRILINYNVIT